MTPDTMFEEVIASGHNAFVYVIKGEVKLEDTNAQELSIGEDQLAVLSEGHAIALRSGDHATRFLLVAGKPLNEPVARGGPFVMNTEAEIRQAFSDYQRGNL